MDDILWGCIADDFTGASDAASFFKKGGLKTVLCNGIPNENMIFDKDVKAVVIALKIRSAKKEESVREALAALKYLQQKGVRQFYFKYCSTFDSTPEGNIGPVADAILDALGETKSILCPALPENGRTVKMGRLYVNGVPLDESPMKDHPVNPMGDSEICALMEPQSKYPCINVDVEEMKEEDEEIWNRLNAFEDLNGKYYIVPDYADGDNAKRITELFGGLKFLTGGSGIIEYLAGKSRESGEAEKTENKTKGRALIIAGSCSVATRRQIDKFIAEGGAAFKINPIRLLYEKQTVNDMWNFVKENAGKAVLVYSSDTPENVKYNQRHGAKEISESLEKAMAELAELAVENGYTRIISAGGETSGAIMKKLGFDSYIIGDSVDPGVPVMIPVQNRNLRVVLKSGNFGSDDFFIKAVKMTGI